MQTYTVDIASEPVTPPIVPINQKLAISLLMVIDMGVKFGERIGHALADHLRPFKPDIIVGAATLGAAPCRPPRGGGGRRGGDQLEPCGDLRADVGGRHRDPDGRP
jgi:hypothetical protein